MADLKRPFLDETDPVPRRAVLEHRVRRVMLEVVSSADTGRTFRSTGERVVVGTHESCDVVLTDKTVSRFHFEILLTEAGPLLRDLRSRNGTVVESVRLIEGLLPDACFITAGQTKLRFAVEGDTVSVPISPSERVGRLVGRSSSMRSVFSLIERAAESDVTVLITGETGTGKEGVAEALHTLGPRKDGPLVVVDCGAIPTNLLESELFGHERGAFTGAVEARVGAFERANGGTIFLDEIGELGPELQPKFLRVLEQKAVQRVGGSGYKPVDVRVIAATHRDLRADINAKRFRSDLYYRLAVVEIRVSPLRDRKEDIPVIVESLLRDLGVADRPEAAPLRAPAFLEGLTAHAWPGNVRELRNYVERTLALGTAEHFREAATSTAPEAAAEHPMSPNISLPLPEARDRWNRLFERQYLGDMLRLHDDNVSAAARAAGVGRIYFYRRLVLHGLR